MNTDPLVDEVREARRRISESVGHDLDRLVDYYQHLQERHRDRLVAPPKPRPKRDDEAA